MATWSLPHPTSPVGPLLGWFVYLVVFAAVVALLLAIAPLRWRRLIVLTASTGAVAAVFSIRIALWLLIVFGAWYWFTGFLKDTIGVRPRPWLRGVLAWGNLAALLGAYYLLRPWFDLMGLAHWAGIAFGIPRAVDFCAARLEGGRLKDESFLAFASYMLYFPGLMEGPIARADRFAQGETFAPSWRGIGAGLACMATGYLKMLFAFLLFNGRPPGFFGPTPMAARSELILFALLIPVTGYLFFAAYSDTARGASYFLGNPLPKNFDNPFSTLSLRQFWRRYHMSLTSWLRDYVYIPLGGNRKRAMLNVAAVYLFIALWHKPSWGFLIWGGVQGLGVILEQQAENHRKPGAANIWLRAGGIIAAAAAFWTVQSVSFSFFYGEYSGAMGLWKAILGMN